MSVNLSKKPSRLYYDGLYRVTQDGYILCNKRRSATLKGTALRPSLEYGKLVYRITVGTKKTTTIRAFIVVREVWGKDMIDPGDYGEMIRGIDAYNTWLRDSYKLKMREKDKAPSRGMCPYCETDEIKRSGTSKTCGKLPCMRAHKRAMAQKQYVPARVKALPSAPRPTPSTEYCMPCPWSTPGKLDVPEPGVSWYSAQADPMTRGVWLEGNLETVKAKRRAA